MMARWQATQQQKEACATMARCSAPSATQVGQDKKGLKASFPERIINARSLQAAISGGPATQGRASPCLHLQPNRRMARHGRRLMVAQRRGRASDAYEHSRICSAPLRVSFAAQPRRSRPCRQDGPSRPRLVAAPAWRGHARGRAADAGLRAAPGSLTHGRCRRHGRFSFRSCAPP